MDRSALYYPFHLCSGETLEHLMSQYALLHFGEPDIADGETEIPAAQDDACGVTSGSVLFRPRSPRGS